MSGRGDIHTPWGKQTLSQRCATVRDQCSQAEQLPTGRPMEPSHYNKPRSPRAAASSSADLEAAPATPPSNAGAATNPLRVGGLTVDPEELGHVAISEAALFALKLIAAHENCSLGRAVEIAAYHYGKEGIGLPGLTDAYQGSAR